MRAWIPHPDRAGAGPAGPTVTRIDSCLAGGGRRDWVTRARGRGVSAWAPAQAGARVGSSGGGYNFKFKLQTQNLNATLRLAVTTAPGRAVGVGKT